MRPVAASLVEETHCEMVLVAIKWNDDARERGSQEGEACLTPQ